MLNIQPFIDAYNGKNGIGDTPANDGQCVGLVEVFLDWVRQCTGANLPHIWGNACDLPKNADRNAYDVIPNTPTYVPPQGAIGICPAGWEGSSVGHCFVVAPGTTQSHLIAFEQNDRLGGGDGRCRLYDGTPIEWPKGLVFIVPKIDEQQAASAQIAPVTVPAPTPPSAPVEPIAPVTPPEVPQTPSPSEAVAIPVKTPETPATPSSASNSSPQNESLINKLEDEIVKAGIKTTEFWVAVYNLASPLVYQQWGVQLPPEAWFAQVAASVMYIAGRVIIKAYH